ncbi:hypothetical protein IF1G_07447 [Cordyceps javanica]|uniref:Uncharacterized protein n=1 Tax=Cordyceps javanica TaxID=43265 RepID=A0A545VS53_9HYPO|nr:hypothetical protein IF1G_07447 [Cordyceps javanica]TQW04504.1 phage-related baseplate assembly protein domain-containing protein [Cordyceps javanica]
MFSHATKTLTAVLALHAGLVLSTRESALESRGLPEYNVLPASEPHEIARVPLATDLVVLTRPSSSELIKAQIDPNTARPVAYRSFTMGRSSRSGLSGVNPSRAYPGRMWMSLKSENKLILVNPGAAADLSAAPTIEMTIDVPAPGNGPHYVYESDDGRVWAGLREPSEQTGKYYVFSADVANPADYRLYECLDSPAFIQQHPATGLVYVTQDRASSIMSIDGGSGATSQLWIPSRLGNTPVGMTALPQGSPLAGVWFGLAGNATGGTGWFGRINDYGEMNLFQVRHPNLGNHPGFVHVADATEQTDDGDAALWLLSTTQFSGKSADALVRVKFNEDASDAEFVEVISLAAQGAKMHRVLPVGKSVLVSEIKA